MEKKDLTIDQKILFSDIEQYVTPFLFEALHKQLF